MDKTKRDYHIRKFLLQQSLVDIEQVNRVGKDVKQAQSGSQESLGQMMINSIHL